MSPTRCVLLAILLLARPVGAQLSAVPHEDVWVANDTVDSLARFDSTLYMAGHFTYVGPYTGSAAPLDETTGALAGAFPKFDGTVNAIAPDGAGGWYVGGTFTQADSTPRAGLAHVLPDGTLDAAWHPEANGAVNAIAVEGATVYVGGGFTMIGGAPRSLLAALDAASGTPTEWNPDVRGEIGAIVSTMAISGSSVFVGGRFTHAAGAQRSNLAALDITTGEATPWNPDADDVDFDIVYTMAIDGSTVYVGGYGQSRLEAVDIVTGVQAASLPRPGGTVYSLLAHDGILYVGGRFTSLGGGSTRRLLAAIDLSTRQTTDWAPDATGTIWSQVTAMAVAGNTIYVGGNFRNLGGEERHNLGAVDRTTGLATPWSPGAGDPVGAIAHHGTAVYVGGEFATTAGAARNRLAALDLSTGQATAWNPRATGTNPADRPDIHDVYMAIDGSRLYVAGSFTMIAGEERDFVAEFDATTGELTNWDPNICSSVGGSLVKSVFAKAGRVYLSSSADCVDGTSLGATTLVALDAETGLADPWTPHVSGWVEAIGRAESATYLGGKFYNINETTRSNLGAVDESGEVLPWAPVPNGTVASMAVVGNRLYVGGSFSTIDGQPRSKIAAFDAQTGDLLPWSTPLGVPDHDVVSAIEVMGDTLFVGGGFAASGGVPRKLVSALSATTGAIYPWNPVANGNAYALAEWNGTLLVGGRFTQFMGSPRPYLASFAALTTDTTGLVTR